MINRLQILSGPLWLSRTSNLSRLDRIAYVVLSDTHSQVLNSWATAQSVDQKNTHKHYTCSNIYCNDIVIILYSKCYY